MESLSGGMARDLSMQQVRTFKYMSTIGQRKSRSSKRFNAVGVSLGGKNTIVDKGSATYKSLISQGGKESVQAKNTQDAYLKSLNHKGSPNYVPTPDDAGYGNSALSNENAALQKQIADGAAKTKLAENQAAGASGVQGYDVQSGDTLSGIASKFGVGMGDITGYKSGDPNKIGVGEKLSIGQRYKDGLAQAQSSGGAVPDNFGGGLAGVQNYTPQEEVVDPQQDIVNQQLKEDPGFQEMQQSYLDYFSPENQKVSLMDTYNKLFKQSGLEKLDHDIIDAQTVIDGTEDDIRNEIQQAGGFGTESQVQAMSLSRNKVLLKNYNNLVALRESKANNLNMQMDFAEKDRTYADSQFDRMMNYQTQMLNYRDKFIQNARDQYNKYTPGQLEMMLANNPRQLAFAEKIMGLGEGGLAKLAAYKEPLSEMDELDLDIKRAQLRKLNQPDVSNRSTQVIDVGGKKMLIDSDTGETIKEFEGDGGIDEATLGKIQASPEFKTINAVLPSIHAIKDYKAAVDKYGSFEKLSGTGRGTKDSTYGNAISAWKSLAGLGALSGADFGLAENVIPKGGKLFVRNSRQKTQLDNALSNAVTQSKTLTQRLTQMYPQASTLLNRQLDDILLTAYPDKYTLGPDGQVYEFTD